MTKKINNMGVSFKGLGNLSDTQIIQVQFLSRLPLVKIGAIV